MKEWQEIYNLTKAELEVASSEDEKANIIRSYHDWKWNFPQSITDIHDKEIRKIRLKRKIEELEKEYAALDSN